VIAPTIAARGRNPRRVAQAAVGECAPGSPFGTPDRRRLDSDRTGPGGRTDRVADARRLGIGEWVGAFTGAGQQVAADAKPGFQSADPRSRRERLEIRARHSRFLTPTAPRGSTCLQTLRLPFPGRWSNGQAAVDTPFRTARSPFARLRTAPSRQTSYRGATKFRFWNERPKQGGVGCVPERGPSVDACPT